ncbi:Hint domain-containing protein [Paracoccus sp. ME4]|uniref:Hint domain-containing protein n=1 Tax=Paracoccus sp. ME4 TaxID=3138066 RepID=UPI00398B7EDE
MAYDGPIYLKGDMLALTSSEPTTVPGLNRGQDGFGMVVRDAAGLGSASDIYCLSWVGNVNNPSATAEFKNGRFWQLERYDPAKDSDGDPQAGAEGWSTIYRQLNPKHDLVQGLGAGDEYVVFEIGRGRHLLYDLNGGLSQTPTTLTYLEVNENGDTKQGDNDRQLDFEDAQAAFCFAQGTMILTPNGERAVECLTPGDLVITRDAGPQPLHWLGSRHLTGAMLDANPKLRPIRIARGALGEDMPVRDLVVSPQHRILVRSVIAQRMVGTQEVLVAARLLVDLDGVSVVQPEDGVGYFHLLFGRHQIVLADGALAESFYPGPQALAAVGPAAREEIEMLFPELLERCALDAFEGARLFATGRKAKNLMARHAKAAKPLVS